MTFVCTFSVNLQAVECSRSHNELYTACSYSILVGKLKSVDGSSQYVLVQCVM